MSVSVLAPVTQITLNGLIPYVLQSCVLVAPVPTPDPDPEPEPEDFIFVPVPPGIEYDSLPVIDPETQIIDTSPNQIIGCANDLPVGVEQQILGALFPDAEASDGIVNRDNNDVWTYDGSAWTNVGPTPGPQIVQVSILPPWNEIVFLNARVRTRLGVQSLAYALELFTEPDPIIVRTMLDVDTLISPSSVRLTLQALAPAVAGAVVQSTTVSIELQGQHPFVRTGYTASPVPASIIASSLAPVGVGVVTVIQPPQVSLQLQAQLLAVQTLQPVNVASIAYAQSSVWPGSTAANNSIMTDGQFNNTGSATDFDTLAWVRMDLGQEYAIAKVIIGTATSNIPGGWSKFYTEDADVQYSLDAVSWTAAFNTGTFPSNGIYEFTVDFSARYIRITRASDYVAISEFYALAPGQVYP
jgi:hypothetical protein